MDDLLVTSQFYSQKITIAEYVIYACVTFFGIIEIVAIILLVWCNKFNCRYLMYMSCVFLFLLCLMSFAACILASMMNPVTYYFC